MSATQRTVAERRTAAHKEWVEEQRQAGRIYVQVLADEVDRQINTIRQWERSGLLPEELHPHRDERGWRWWTPEQVEKIKQWMKDEHVGPGRGLIIARQMRET